MLMNGDATLWNTIMNSNAIFRNSTMMKDNINIEQIQEIYISQLMKFELIKAYISSNNNLPNNYEVSRIEALVDDVLKNNIKKTDE